MNELHLFAGAGGGILGGMLLGHTCVCAVEIDPYCRQVLLQRQRDRILPRFPIWDDVRTFDGEPWRGLVDVVCGGFPCQDISEMGEGAGIDGSRSGLWREQARIIREVEPRHVVVENSPMLTSRGLGRVLGDLATMGYDARWGVLGAWEVGLDSIRNRIWIVADSASLRWKRRSKSATQEKMRATTQRMEACRRPRVRFDIPTPDAFGNPIGMANRMDRLTAIGNGQVPAVAALAWNALIAELTEK